MDDVFAKIAEETVTFNLGDENVGTISQFDTLLITFKLTRYEWYVNQNWRVLYEPLYGEPPDNVGLVRDERYGPAERNKLDVYFPLRDGSPEKPVVLFVHGGGFFSNDKAWSEKVSNHHHMRVFLTNRPCNIFSAGPISGIFSHSRDLSLSWRTISSCLMSSILEVLMTCKRPVNGSSITLLRKDMVEDPRTR